LCFGKIANGCNAVLTRGIAGEHEEKCDYAILQCKYNPTQCGDILRKDFEEHLTKCPYRFVKCPQNGCDVMLPPHLIDVSACFSSRFFIYFDLKSHNDSTPVSFAHSFT
jgi:hypothetical protein